MSGQSQVTGERQWRLQTWLRIQPSAKPQVYQRVFATTEVNSLSYWLEIFFSAGIATLGLVENSPAVIIGAMLISPLMGPIMATGLALAIGDVYLGFKAVLNLVASITVSIAFSALLVWLLPFHSATAEIVARTNPNLLDLGIALLSGLAGSVVVCRDIGEGVTALPGVAIAVALMPPLCTMGFGLGSGGDLEIMGGAGLLFLTNLVAIVATAFSIFLLVGMGAPEVEQAMHASRSGEPLARKISYGPIARILSTGGQLRWRILMVAVLLAAIAVPLRRALLQVASETITRGAVQDELRPLLRSGGVVSQQVNLGDKEIIIRLLSTQRIPDSRIAAIRDDLMRKTGRDVQLSVDAVASKSELADLMERLERTAPPVIAKEKTFAELQQELLARVQPAIEQIWPATDAPIQNFDVISGPQGAVVEVHYQAAADLGPVPLDMVQKSVRATLGMPDLTLKAERVLPPAAPAAQQQNQNETDKGNKKRKP
ncbi:MAG TPA: DUF389 domain-containing protein [Bryobacteraceae bacterium]|nr:DUF389 domain-containing protein [Bryobacteraceae bacterium]